MAFEVLGGMEGGVRDNTYVKGTIPGSSALHLDQGLLTRRTEVLRTNTYPPHACHSSRLL